MEKRKHGSSENRILIIAACVFAAAALFAGGLYAKTKIDERKRLAEAEAAAQEIADARAEEEAQYAADAEENARAIAEDEDEEGVISYNGKKYRYNEHLSNYLLLGIDTKGDIQEERQPVYGGQSDAIFVIAYDRKEETTRILSIPRDTMCTVERHNLDGDFTGRVNDHIAVQYAYGDGKYKSCELTRDCVSKLLLGVPILGYASLNLDGLPLLAKVLDGVELVVPDDSLEAVDPTFKKGETVLITEENAERYLRYRDITQHQQAIVRMNRQKVFIEAFAKKLREKQKQNARTITSVYETLKPHMVTNIGNDVFADLVAASQEGGITTIPGEGVDTDLYDEYHVDEDALYGLILETFYVEVGENE